MGAGGNILGIVIFGLFKHTRTYDASNPTEHINVSGECTLTPRHTTMQTCIYIQSQWAKLCSFIYSKHQSDEILNMNNDTKIYTRNT